MGKPIDLARDFTDDDLAGMARRIANNGIQSAEISTPEIIGYGHYYREHVELAALEILRAVALHERQRGERDTSTLVPTHYN